MQSEKFNRWVVTSVALHCMLGVVILIAPSLFPASSNASFGSNAGGSDGVNVKIVSNFSGIPLPSPPVVKEDAVANDSPGLYKNEPAAPPEPVKEAVKLPDSRIIPKKQPPKQPAAPDRGVTPEPPSPSNAVPYGQGGRPDLQYGQVSTGAGTAGALVGDGSFGERYGWYVQSITRQISQNWLQSLVDNRLQSAPRVYLRFTIARDGSVSDVEVQQSSNIPTLDNSAIRAIRRSSPLPSLPPDYRGSNVSVSFYFEYVR